MTTIVVGLDGGSFSLLDEWIDDGTCSTLRRLKNGGQWSPLSSSLPPVTCPAWRCYSTGVNPGKHGVFWWEQLDREREEFTVPTSADFDAPDIWDYLGSADRQSAVINMPTTFPPEELNGTMISGGGGVDSKQFTYPPELQSTIDATFDYSAFIDAPTSEIGADPSLVEDVLALVDTRFDVAEYIRDEYDPDFINLTIFYTNVFHHFFWDGEPTKQIWERVDQNLSEFIRPDDRVVVISDHGTNEIAYTFNINTWLEEQGYLVTTDTVSDGLHKLHLTRDRLTAVASSLGLKNTLKRLLPRRVIDTVPRDDGGVTGSGKAKKIDWERSTAMASGQGPIYVLTDDPQERNAIREELKRELESIKAPNGEPIAAAVHNAEDVYSGPYVKEGPDLVAEQADHMYISGALNIDGLFESPNEWIAENHRDGIMIANGPEIPADGKLAEQPTIYDITPTLLHWLGEPVPETLDGRVLTELFAEDSVPAARDIERTTSTLDDQNGETGDGHEEIRDRLTDLGYLSE